MNQEEFVHKAQMVVEALGSKSRVSSNGLTFDDGTIMIRTNYNGLDLEITRRAQVEGPEHLRVENPTTMVMKGVIIRHHGEHAYLVDHLNALCARC